MTREQIEKYKSDYFHFYIVQILCDELLRLMPREEPPELPKGWVPPFRVELVSSDGLGLVTDGSRKVIATTNGGAGACESAVYALNAVYGKQLAERS